MIKRTFGSFANKIIHDVQNKEFYALINKKKGNYSIFKLKKSIFVVSISS